MFLNEVVLMVSCRSASFLAASKQQESCQRVQSVDLQAKNDYWAGHNPAAVKHVVAAL